jgi:hypothetical protein
VAALALVGALGLVAVAVACSLSDVKRTTCTNDNQCAGAFGTGSRCQGGYCTDPATAPTCNPAGTEPDGRPCFGCPPTKTVEFHNACTDSTCQPFDNATRLTKLTADGGLPPLPSDGGP